jgi:hypothetical protein
MRREHLCVSCADFECPDDTVCCRASFVQIMRRSLETAVVDERHQKQPAALSCIHEPQNAGDIPGCSLLTNEAFCQEETVSCETSLHLLRLILSIHRFFVLGHFMRLYELHICCVVPFDSCTSDGRNARSDGWIPVTVRGDLSEDVVYGRTAVSRQARLGSIRALNFQNNFRTFVCL